MRIYTETPLRLMPPRGVVIAPDWDRPAPRPPEPDLEVLKARLAEALRADLVRMLSRWVSECEPCIVNRWDGLRLGLALDGTADVVVPSGLATLEACLAAMADASS